MRADRLVSLVLLLQARGTVTARDLARALDVSVRTIYRDLAVLSTSGVPVLAEPGPGGGCRLVDGYRFPLRSLRPEEAEAVLILGVPEVLSELGLGHALTAAHRQIRVTAGLDGHGQPGGHEQAPALVHLDMPGWFRSREDVPQLRTLAEALRQRRQLAFRYSSGTRDARLADGGDPAARSTGTAQAAHRSARAAGHAPLAVSPLGVVNKAGTWYLVALTRGAGRRGPGQVRVFRVARIAWARVVDEAASRPEGFDLATFWAAWSEEFASSRPRLKVRLRASPRALAVFPEVFGDQVLEAVGAALPPDTQGWQELTLSFEHELAAAQRLAGFGGQLEVLAPLSVRERLVATAHTILRRYGVGSAASADQAISAAEEAE